MNQNTGGFNTVNEFKKVILEVSKNGTEFRLESRANQFVNDFKGDKLVQAFPLVFPYGTGGPNELRYVNNIENCRMKLEQYMKHIIRSSHTAFHTQLFSLCTFNLLQKQRMIDSAFLRTKDSFATLDAHDLRTSVYAREQGGGIITNDSANKFIESIECISRNMPHTNASARAAQSDIMSMVLTFNQPSVFLTYTPDDSCSLFMTAYSDFGFDNTKLVSDMSSEDIIASARQRETIRQTLPGVAALLFEEIVEIVLEDIIGWQKPNGGRFGTPEAYFMTVEEQGRKTLHMHICLWIKDFSKKRQTLQSKSCRKRQEIKKDIIKFVDHCVSNELISSNNYDILMHFCPGSSRNKLPLIVDEQKLRQLRHKTGCLQHNGTIACCNTCDKTWTNESLVEEFLRKKHSLSNLSTLHDRHNPYIAELIYRSQFPSNDNSLDSDIIQALNNMHYTQHCKGCFKYSSECRYNMPKPNNTTTRVQLIRTEPNWYCWNGTEATFDHYEIIPKRNEYDLFVNNYDPAFSRSTIASNSNVRVLMYGRECMYTIKYSTKGTQNDETEEYSGVVTYCERRMAEIRRESPQSEGMSRLVGASIMHGSKNVIAAPMARFLTSTNSRFRMSHTFQIIPICDLKAMLIDQPVRYYYRKDGDDRYATNLAQHYLMRPQELEDISCIDFYTQFDIVTKRAKRQNDTFMFTDENHPGRSFLMVRKRIIKVLPKVNNWSFLDARKLKGNIMENNDEIINEITEKYAENILVLFGIYRTINELQIDGSFVKKLRNWLPLHSENDRITEFLQNVQDIYNSLHMPCGEDDLTRNTEPFYEAETDDNGTDINEPDAIPLEWYINSLIENEQEHNDSQGILPMSFQHLIRCGSEIIANVTQMPHEINSNTINDFNISNKILQQTNNIYASFIRHISSNEQEIISTFTENVIDYNPVTKQRLMQLFLTRQLRRLANSTHIQQESKINATGTCESIVKWGMRNLDKEQQRAFQILIGSFVLTYFDEAVDDFGQNDRRATTRHEFTLHKRSLLQMVEQSQVIMFLTGPGGSGKSRVIEEVLSYAKEFCMMLEVPFTSRTIQICAMSGVAATLIKGETAHSALFLSKDHSNITEEIMLAFKPVRLVIIDEISFAGIKTVRHLDSTLRLLTNNFSTPFGGKHIAFMGDFRQLEPPKDKALYSDLTFIQWHTYINCFIELNGMFRFKDDPEYGHILLRFREGAPTENDFRLINERVLPSNITPPDNIPYATFTNKQRDSINTASFLKYAKSNNASTGEAYSSLLILLDDIEILFQNQYKKATKRQYFYEFCGEDDIDFSHGRLDPVLKVYRNCLLMLTMNKDVARGQANGTEVKLLQVVLKENTVPIQHEMDNTIVHLVYASQVDHLVLRHTNDNLHNDLGTFKLSPQKVTFDAYMPNPYNVFDEKQKQKVKMRGFQFTAVSNTATTGHKLQGKSLRMLYISDWCYHCKNWPYVMLSRVTTRSGLFLNKPLDPNKDYSTDSRYDRMIQSFQSKRPNSYDDYQS
jgi:Helitron helicase-like domain at N-terminus/PIF1-like helicase